MLPDPFVRPAASRPSTPLVAALALVFAAPLALAQSATEPALSARRIVIDSETGRPRAPEGDEIAAMKARAASAASTQRSAATARAAAPQLSNHPVVQHLQGQRLQAGYGATGRRLTVDKLAFTVVRRNADGSVETSCVEGESAAKHALHTHAREAADAQ